MTDIAWRLLQPALNLGLSEFDYWNMTVAEVVRYCEGATWRTKTQAQLDYVLADLIGASVARLMTSNAKYPPIEQVYPTLFTEEARQAREEEERLRNSTNRFMEWAMRHNAKKRNKGVETK